MIESSKNRLAAEMVLSARDQCRTPVLVLPAHVRVCAPLLIDVVHTIQEVYVAMNAETSPSQFRFDWMLGNEGIVSLMADRFAARRAKKMSATVSKQTGVETLVQVTATVGRTKPDDDGFTIGWADAKVELPEWTSPFLLHA